MVEWAGYLGWLHSSYQQSKDGPTISRVEYYGDAVWIPEQPCEFLTEVFLNSGMATSNGMGLSPLPWAELLAMNTALRYDLSPWQMRVIRRMSQAYCSWIKKGESASCDPPVEPTDEDVIAEIRQHNQMKMREILSARSR